MLSLCARRSLSYAPAVAAGARTHARSLLLFLQLARAQEILLLLVRARSLAPAPAAGVRSLAPAPAAPTRVLARSSSASCYCWHMHARSLMPVLPLLLECVHALLLLVLLVLACARCCSRYARARRSCWCWQLAPAQVLCRSRSRAGGLPFSILHGCARRSPSSVGALADLARSRVRPPFLLVRGWAAAAVLSFVRSGGCCCSACSLSFVSTRGCCCDARTRPSPFALGTAAATRARRPWSFAPLGALACSSSSLAFGLLVVLVVHDLALR